MASGKKWLTQMLAFVWVVGLLWAATPALAGMAELGKRRNQEAGTDPAAGDGFVWAVLDQAYPCDTSATGCATAGQIVSTLAAAIHNPPQRIATASDDTLTVLRGNPAREVDQFGMVSTDSLLEFVQATHANGALFVLAVCETPAGGTVQIQRGGVVAASVVTDGLSAEQVNDQLRSQLGPTANIRGDCGEHPLSPKRRRIKVIGSTVAWSDDDPGIKTIGVVTPGANIPTLSQWGLLLLVALLGTAALILIQRRRRSMAV